VRVLTWNLFHGRSLPPLRRELIEEFAAALRTWSWDVALLQEVPPWWPPTLAAASRAEQRTALTSRNLGLPLRRALARRDPELMKSNGGGANALLARVPVSEHHRVRLRTWPERRIAQLARLDRGIAVANFHGSTRVPLAEQELERLGSIARAFAGPATRLVLGGDLNLRAPQVTGMEHVAARDVDHLFAAGLRLLESEVLDRCATVGGVRVELSDHPPLLAALDG
jgi:endonuclease/exonuclease/phosphatase family metal-dependent hydrolase